jgi:hypothetical protein
VRPIPELRDTHLATPADHRHHPALHHEEARVHRLTLKGKFKENSRNIQEHAGNIQSADHHHHPVLHHKEAMAHRLILKGNIQGTFRAYSRNIQGTFREHSGNIQGT